MRNTLIVALLGAGVNGLNLPRQAVSGPTGPAPTNTVVVYNESKFPLLQPDQALSALYEKAKASPSAVSILAGIPIPTEVSKAISDAKDSAKADVSFSEVSTSEDVAMAPAKLDTTPTCANPGVHKEWRNVSAANKLAYVNAIKCLQGKPARSGLRGVQTRWDDLVAIHQSMANIIHNVGQFLPWHRYMLKMLEKEMRGTCGYSGPMIWWDETKDAGHFGSAPMMTAQYFGSMPEGNAVCITNGVFASEQCHIGPGSSDTTHCLARGCSENLSAAITQSFVNTCASYGDYEDVNSCIFFGPHAYGHDAIGGDMSDVQTSPNDPLFYLHHAFVDRNWYNWQAASPSTRTYAIGGYTRQNCGNSCTPTTLTYQLTSFGFYPPVTVEEVMNTESTYLCYKYDY